MNYLEIDKLEIDKSKNKKKYRKRSLTGKTIVSNVCNDIIALRVQASSFPLKICTLKIQNDNILLSCTKISPVSTYKPGSDSFLHVSLETLNN